MATLEEIDGEAWFRGDRDEAYPTLVAAEELFEEARSKFVESIEHCEIYRQWDQPENRNELIPDLEVFHKMVERLGTIVGHLQNRELPSLELIHGTDDLMRNQMVVGERKALAYRGTRGHFPLEGIYAEDGASTNGDATRAVVRSDG